MLTTFAGGQVFAERCGKADPTVLALHGWQRTHQDMLPAVQGLDALAVDLPGFGWSPPPEQAWGTADYAAELIKGFDQFACPPIVLGHSFGGRIAVRLASSYPEQVRGLVLTGVPLLRPVSSGSPSPWFRLGRALHKRGLMSDERMEALRQRYGSTDYKQAEGVLRQILVNVVSESYEQDLRLIDCPIFLVWGERDTAAPVAMAEAAVSLCRKAHLTVLKNVGHMVPIAAPGALREAIDSCLAET